MRVPPFALVWWVLTGGALGWDAFAVGVPAVLAAASLSATMLPPAHWSAPGTFKLAGFFLWESLRGGVDVARRALSPGMPLAPAIVMHDYTVRSELARTLVADISSLLPGSLALEIEPSRLAVHALDARGHDAAESVRDTERRVAAWLGERPPDRGAAPGSE